ncbi:MAG: hypothetical protein NZO58_00365 [Gemmataceae bacterium]|nr:hypothetical protein [Gemmataceae bacterium]
MALEYCSGGSLDQKLLETPLKPREAAELVTASVNGSRRVWDAATGRELVGEPVPADDHDGPAVSPDDRLFLYTGEGNVVLIVSLTPDEEELNYRRYKTRPRPEVHAEQAKQLEKDDPFAAAVQRALEQRARGQLALEAGDEAAARRHFEQADRLDPRKSPPPAHP